METVFSVQLYNTPEYHLYICSLGVQRVLHHPELYIESNYEYSWQNYVNNMARQGTWTDNIIIQAVANSLYITINIIVKSAYEPNVAHQARAYPGFCSIKQLGLFLLPPGWDASLLQGYPQH